MIGTVRWVFGGCGGQLKNGDRQPKNGRTLAAADHHGRSTAAKYRFDRPDRRGDQPPNRGLRFDRRTVARQRSAVHGCPQPPSTQSVRIVILTITI